MLVSFISQNFFICKTFGISPDDCPILLPLQNSMEWTQYYDPTTGHYYYHNNKTKETTWTIPEKFEPAVKEEDEQDLDIQAVAPVGLKYDWGERQMGHYFNVNEYRSRVQEQKKEKPKKLTKKQISEFKKKKKEKQRKKKQWLFE